MGAAIENLKSAMERGMAGRPKIAGFPYLAEVLRQAGITRNIWTLPACQSMFLTTKGPVIMQASPLVTGIADIPLFDQNALVMAIRADQAGESTFPEFLMAAWKAGVVSYEVDFFARVVSYYGLDKENYAEAYPEVNL